MDSREKEKYIINGFIKNAEPSITLKKKNFFKRISYAIIPFCIFLLTLGLSWLGNQLLGRTGSTYPALPIDDKIPLVPWFVYFYFLTFPLGIITFFYTAYKSRKNLFTLFLTLVISFAISGVIYFFWQSRMIKPDLEPNSFTDKLVLWTWGSCDPTNCFPSQHCFMAIAMIIACCSTKKLNIFFKIFTSLCCVMIILSTVFLRQHYILDFFGSFDIMIIVYYLVRLFKLGDKLDNFTSKCLGKKYYMV